MSDYLTEWNKHSEAATFTTIIPLKKLPLRDLLADIEGLQNVQKRNPMDSKAWKNASADLQPLFAEMARRQKVGLL